MYWPMSCYVLLKYGPYICRCSGPSHRYGEYPHWICSPRDGTTSFPYTDTQHSSVTFPTTRSGPSGPFQSPATREESIRDALCNRGFSIDVASHVSRTQRDSKLGIYESKWRIFSDWCIAQQMNPLSSSESVVSNFLLHLHTDKHLAISIIASYQVSVASTLRATFGVEVGRNPALKSLFRNIEMEHHTSIFQSGILPWFCQH